MTERDQILQTLSAIQPVGKVLPKSIQWRSERSVNELWAIFEERLRAVGGKVATVEDLVELVAGRVLIEANLSALPLRGRVGEQSEPERGQRAREDDHPHPVHFVHSLPPQGGGVLSECADPWIADLSITTAKLAIAESGTLLLETDSDKPRLSSLAPPRHIVLIDQEKIVEKLEEAMPYVSERTSVFITGPSRTADIEGTLVHGVHGPKELVVVPH